jgi:hypothetical protein
VCSVGDCVGVPPASGWTDGWVVLGLLLHLLCRTGWDLLLHLLHLSSCLSFIAGRVLLVKDFPLRAGGAWRVSLFFLFSSGQAGWDSDEHDL